MSSKKIILILGMIVVVAVAVFLFFSARSDTATDGGGGGFSIRSFFPFGNPSEVPADNAIPEDTGTDSSTDFQTNVNQPIPKLRKVSADPVAGAVLLVKPKSTSTVVRFVAKDTGNVYEVYSDSLEKKRLTNTTIPKINRAIWLSTGEGFLAQKADESGLVETSHIRLRLTVATTSSSNELRLPYEPVISSLPTAIKEITPSPDGKKIFYYRADSGMKGYVSNPDGTSSTLVYSGNISEWIPNWFSQSSILLTTKAGFNADSFGFFLNPNNKTLGRAFGRIVGGSALPKPDGKYILASTGGGEPNLFLVTVSNEKVTSVSTRTMSEKCAWRPDGVLAVVCGVPKSIPRANYPDSWYQGLLSTNDEVLAINLENNGVTFISDLSEESGEKIDIQNISLSRDGFFALFTNKLDQSLWLLDLR